jgi:hypothetical protein
VFVDYAGQTVALAGATTGEITAACTPKKKTCPRGGCKDGLTSTKIMVHQETGKPRTNLPAGQGGRISDVAPSGQPIGFLSPLIAYFSPSWTAFQADRGRHFSVIVDGVSS